MTQTATEIHQRSQTYNQALLETQSDHSTNIKDPYLPRSTGYGRTRAQHNIPGALLHTVILTHHTDGD
jgi:hypothetical protein